MVIRLLPAWPGLFHSPEDVFRLHPLEKADFTDWPHVSMNWDFSSEEAIYQAAEARITRSNGVTMPP